MLYHNLWNQLIMSYQVNEVIAKIPKSHNSNYHIENIYIFDSELTKKDIETIYNMNCEKTPNLIRSFFNTIFIFHTSQLVKN